MISSRELFFETLNQKPVTDIQKAAQFYFLVTRSFGGRGKTFGVCIKSKGGAGKSHENQFLRIEAINKRLDTVMVENKDFEALIKSYDHKEAFFYCDPPYSHGVGYETTSCERFDHNRLCTTLKSIKGRFLLSYDDCELIRNLYKGFEMIEVSRRCGINSKNGYKEYKELLIANYKIK